MPLAAKSASPEEAQVLLTPTGHSTCGSSLKWELVTVGVGMALVIVHLSAFHGSEPIVAGLLLLFAGAALLMLYLLRTLSPERWIERDAAC